MSTLQHVLCKITMYHSSLVHVTWMLIGIALEKLDRNTGWSLNVHTSALCEQNVFQLPSIAFVASACYEYGTQV